MNEANYRTCERCKQKRETLCYTVCTKTRGKEQIVICQSCLQTLIECQLTYEALNWPRFKSWCEGKIPTTELVESMKVKLYT